MPGNTKGIYYRYVYCHRAIADDTIFVQPFPTTSLILCSCGLLALKTEAPRIHDFNRAFYLVYRDNEFILLELEIKGSIFSVLILFCPILSLCFVHSPPFVPILILCSPLKCSLKTAHEPCRMGFSSQYTITALQTFLQLEHRTRAYHKFQYRTLLLPEIRY